jgi:hypothetical protein
MPIKDGKYRIVDTPKGPVRLHFNRQGVVDEAKNMRTGATHSPAEFAKDRKNKEK